MADSNSHLCIPHALRSLYEPQLNQFGITPHPNGDGWSGTGESQWGHGSAWGAPLGDSCIVFSHEICIEREMALTESPQSAYACVCLVSEDTQATMPKMIARPRALLDGSLYSFVQPAGQFTGSSQKGRRLRIAMHLLSSRLFRRTRRSMARYVHGDVREIRRSVGRRGIPCNHDNPFRNRAATRTWLRAAPTREGRADGRHARSCGKQKAHRPATSGDS